MSLSVAPIAGVRGFKTADAVTGADLFLIHCERCHGGEGEGRGFDFPALKNSRRLSGGNAEETIAWILTGNRARPGFVTDSSFEMPGFGNLDDRDIASLTQYVRCRFAKRCGAVGPSDVKAVRARQSSAK